MGIQKIKHEKTSVFGMKIEGKLTVKDIEAFLPELEKAIEEANKKLRLLVDSTKMTGAKIKSEWKIFKFLKKHMKDIELIAIVGAHSWTKVMNEILMESVFVEAPTLYFKSDEIEKAWKWLTTATAPRHLRVRRYVDSDKGLFTKYSSPDYI